MSEDSYLLQTLRWKSALVLTLTGATWFSVDANQYSVVSFNDERRAMYAEQRRLRYQAYSDAALEHFSPTKAIYLKPRH